ncbi:phospholipase A2 inhibitor and Ly6/PLAUR domain-containing protein-like [Elgaria multicarinata webbii]|uniref:phospholipase A2 inhibitor and Ly6/PLAUR domain-containing protein-like n=1 Tax=Elgaria multicarinata webbii TaxID=159646 RepID=UPI002FCCDF55
MKTTLLSIFIFLALLSPGTSLICLTCSSFGRSFCEANKEKQCTEKDTCISTVMSSTIYNGPRELAQNRCFRSNWCYPASFSFTSENNMYFAEHIDCCQTDRCNPKSPELPPRELNGLQCPACYDRNKNNCTGTETVNCYDDETRCIDFVGSLFEPRIRKMQLDFQGCATQDFCNFAEGKTRQVNDFLKIETKKTQCSAANEAPISPDLQAN